MQTIAITTARQNIFQIIKDVVSKHFPIRISTKDGGAVLLPEDEYDNLMETLHLLSYAGFKQSIKKARKEAARGELYTMDDVFGK